MNAKGPPRTSAIAVPARHCCPPPPPPPPRPLLVTGAPRPQAEVLKVVFDPESGTLCVVMANGKLFWIDVPESVILGWTQLDLAESKVCRTWGGLPRLLFTTQHRWRNRAPGPHRNTTRQAMDSLWTEVCGQHKQSNDPGNNQHILNMPIIGRR